MPNKAFNYDFKLLLEGVECPFNSVQIMNTPNGVEANVNLMASKEVYDLKPKTAVQIFYRDWVNIGKKRGWRLLCDGFLSSYYKTDESLQGRGLSIVVRDFRMDIRKAPAALAWQGMNELTNIQYYHTAGLFNNWVVHGKTPEPPTGKKKETVNAIKKKIAELKAEITAIEESAKGKSGIAQKIAVSKIRISRENIAKLQRSLNSGSGKGNAIRSYGNSGIQDLGEAIAMIAGTAYGKGINFKANPEDPIYTSRFGKSMKADPRNGSADAGTFLDAVIRGMWTEAVGGTSIGAFQNRRTRLDKRFMIPKNDTGYKFWSKQNGGLEVGNVIMGNSRFSSLEAAIMRLAGLFSVRVYSCSTPALVSLDGPALKWVMADDVKRFLVDTLDFGNKYILNETMLLPPLEFTAPPNCNLVLPPMCNRIVWQYDIDADITRGYFKQIDTLSTKGSGGSLSAKSVQVPNALFNIYSEKKNKNGKNSDANNNKKDEFNRVKPPLTLEERYKGVSVYHGNVEVLLAQNDAAKSLPEETLSQKAAEKVRKAEAELQESKEKLRKEQAHGFAGSGNGFTKTTQGPELPGALINNKAAAIVEEAASKDREKKRKRKARAATFAARTQNALNRHALLKFLNLKYSGRTLVVDMAFNPYIMCGFPGAVISDDEAYGGQSTKTVIGMVQQVKHIITITPGGADASTTAVFNNARFEDEPTDLDPYGNPLYMKSTDPTKAKVSNTTYELDSNYYVPKPEPLVGLDKASDHYDLQERKGKEGYVYAKDIITLTKRDRQLGESNSIYLDKEYEPNRIHKFYKEVFAHNQDSFMLGTTEIDGKPSLFSYDTMHEAFVRMREDKPYLLNDYEQCIRFVHRDICSASAFYQGILGSSVLQDESGAYEVDSGPYDETVIKDEYFGVSTEKWNDSESLKAIGGNKNDRKILPSGITGPGQFSSIREHMPVTSFIKERRDSAKAYIESVKVRAQGAQFGNNE